MKKRKNKIFKIILLIFCLTGFESVKSQPSGKGYPVIGEPVPDFRLTNVDHYVKRTFDPREVKNKWIVLDFWHKYCAGCIKSFPKVDQLQREFKDRVQFLLIGNNKIGFDNGSNLEQVYEQNRKIFGLQLAVAYDSTLVKQFGVAYYPHIIIIDPHAKVYAITNALALNRENIQSLVNNQNPAFPRQYGSHEPRDSLYNTQFRKWEYLFDEQGERRDFLYRSVLSKSTVDYPQGTSSIDASVSNGLFQNTRVNLFDLYNIAYLGITDWIIGNPIYKIYWKYPLLELKDTSNFKFDNQTLEGYYSYSLVVPKEKSSREYLMKIMRGDLENYFGYDVSYETRMMPCWILTATDEARKNLRTTIAAKELSKFDGDPISFNGKKIKIENLLFHIWNHTPGDRIPMIDKTNISEPIDIVLKATMTDMNDVVRALERKGLILRRGTKEFKVLVIRDPESRVSN